MITASHTTTLTSVAVDDRVDHPAGEHRRRHREHGEHHAEAEELQQLARCGVAKAMIRLSVSLENGRLSSCAFIAWYIDIHAVTSMSTSVEPS